MAYYSDVDLGGIGEAPKTTDPEVFPDFTDVYNAIHILAQWVDSLKSSLGGGDETTPPWEAMPFRNYFYTEAAQRITEGNVVTVIHSQSFNNATSGVGSYFSIDGAVKGVPGPNIIDIAPSGYPHTARHQTYPMARSLIGLALSDAEIGELVKIGVGPAIFRLNGIRKGEPIFAYQAWQDTGWPVPFARRLRYKLIGNGNLIRVARSGNVYFPYSASCVAVGVATDSAMFCPPNAPWSNTLSTPDVYDPFTGGLFSGVFGGSA